jgi:hypothetical protein
MRGTPLQVRPNRVANKTNVLQLRVPEATRFDVPFRFQERITLRISLLMLRESVLASIEFQIVASLGAIEVKVVPLKLVLAAEFVSGEPAAAEQAPQSLLGPRRFLPQKSGEV